MPRLTDKTYLEQRTLLHRCWADRSAHGFSYLTYKGQMVLHHFYAPSKLLSREGALAHRQEVSRHDYSLPQRAGRAFKRILPFLPEPWPVTDTPVPVRSRRHRGADRIVVTAIARPEPDLRKLVTAAVELASQDIERDLVKLEQTLQEA
ncbi:hypothetical protein [Arthrobacter sp. RCC_34]|uniref:hypothetical protein n=1 Tax=Arthrobacter sp. RCC_34 TaxID=3239230 RepID=UPI003525EDC6